MSQLSFFFQRVFIRWKFLFLYPFYWVGVYVRQWPLFYANLALFRLDLYLGYYYFFFYNPVKEYLEKSETGLTQDELTYGEMPYLVLDNVFKAIGAHSNDVFLDCGCGKGKLVFFAAMVYGMKADGIEILPTYVKVARQQAHIRGLSQARFFAENFANLSFEPYSIVVLTWTCFSEAMREDMTERLKSLKSGSVVITISYPIQSEAFYEVYKRVEYMSWGKGVVFVHKRK